MIDALFLGFSVNLILSCILTITAYNAVGALIALVFAFINATCIFFLMDLEFIGLLFLIVYVGAISVLFLFSVMLFNLKDVVRTKTTSFILKNTIALLVIALLFLSLFTYTPVEMAQNYEDFISIIPNNNELYIVGQVLYGKYLLFLILASVILLIAMLGAVVLINNPKEQVQNQHPLKQITRTINITNNF